jgi:transposase
MKTAEIIPLEQVWVENANLRVKLIEKEERLTDSEKKIEHLSQENNSLKEQLAWFKRQIFGKRSERVVANLNEQQLMFEGFENPEAPKEEEKKTVAAHTRSKPNRNGQDKITLSPDLPVQTTILDIPEEQKVCQETGKPLVQIGVEITHKLAHQPGSYYIKEIIRPKYAHPEKEEAGILTAPLPDSLLPKCRADESLLAEIITKKFADHLPLYRIGEIFSREGVRISRKLLSQWVISVSKALKPLYNEMLKRVLSSKNIYIDETPVKLWETEKCKQAYMWVVVGGSESNPAYRIYQFKEDRCHDNVLEILKDYQGGLHSDKFGAYQRLAERKIITWYPCFSHIRRKFFEAESGDPQFKAWVLRKIRYLFMLERVAWARSPEERLKIRQEKEVPILDELIEKIKAKLVDGKILPKSKLKEAIGYFYGLIPYLKNYTKNAFARLDNNVAERAVRPLAIGRKNWLFFGSPNGGEAGAILFSLVQTCRGLNINPREYLEDIMRRIMAHNSQKLHELLPDEWLKNRQ